MGLVASKTMRFGCSWGAGAAAGASTSDDEAPAQARDDVLQPQLGGGAVAAGVPPDRLQANSVRCPFSSRRQCGLNQTRSRLRLMFSLPSRRADP